MASHKVDLQHRLLVTIVAFALLLFHCELDAQFVTIPDTAFVSWLNQNGFNTCMNGNQLDTTCPALLDSTDLECFGIPIRNLEGIQYFKNLTRLSCYYDSLSLIPSLPASLIYIDCYVNLLTSLPTLPNNLQFLDCYGNKLDSLPVLPNSLYTLDCSYNQLSTLPTLPSSLNSFNCGYNHISILPDLPTGLQMLACQYNQLDSLPALPSSVWVITCHHNLLTFLPELPHYLPFLICNNNPIRCLPYIDSIGEFDFDSTSITCLPNYPWQDTLEPCIPPLASVPLCSNFNPEGCPNYSDLYNISSILNLSLFPNPSNSDWTLIIGPELLGSMLQVFDATGRLVYKSSILNTDVRITISNPSSGVYELRIISDNYSVVKKLVRI